MYSKNFLFKDIVGLSLLLTTTYYFYKYSTFANTSFLVFFLDLSLLFLFSLFYFFLIKSIIGKIEYKINRKFINILLIVFSSYLCVQTLKGFIFLINSKLTLSNLLITKIFYIFDFGNLFLDKTIIYFIPYIFFFIIFFFTQIRIVKIIKFISIVGYIFLSILLFREINTNLTIDTKIKKNSTKIANDYVIKNVDKNRKVIWILFDGFDPQIAFDSKKKISLPNFENILKNSVFGKNFYSPAKRTSDSLPALLLGSQTRGRVIKNSKYYLKNENFELIELSFNNSIFGELNNLGLKSSVFSSVLEYCSAYLRSNQYLQCKENQNNKYNLPAKRYFEGIFFIFLPINKIKYLYNYKEKERFNKILYNINDYNKLSANKSKFDENDVDGHQTIFYSEIKKTIKDSNLLFLHLYIPHPGNPNHAKNVFGRSPESELDSHMLNLKLSDLALGKILDLIPSDNDTMIVLASDHWFRAKDKNPKNIYPSLFLTKIINDQKKIIINQHSSSIYIRELIIKYLKSEINNHDDIYSYIKSKPMHETYIEE